VAKSQQEWSIYAPCRKESQLTFWQLSHEILRVESWGIKYIFLTMKINSDPPEKSLTQILPIKSNRIFVSIS
jgi:hypothetical protein